MKIAQQLPQLGVAHWGARQVGELLGDAVAQHDQPQVRQRVLVEELSDESLQGESAESAFCPPQPDMYHRH